MLVWTILALWAELRQYRDTDGGGKWSTLLSNMKKTLSASQGEKSNYFADPFNFIDMPALLLGVTARRGEHASRDQGSGTSRAMGEVERHGFSA